MGAHALSGRNIWHEKIAGTYGGNKWCKKNGGKIALEN
jgi:hypothetical protein